MDMEREILNLKEYDLIPLIDESWEDRDEYHEIDENGDLIIKSGEWDNFKLITSDLDYYDLEKDYEVVDNVIQRNSDGKYFKFKYTWSSYNGYRIRFNQQIEVFPKQITKIIYE